MDKQVNVFISYARSDEAIARVLFDDLTHVNRERVHCFLDTAKIPSGQKFEEVIIRELREADWLICVYTGEQSEYCGFEIGIFQAAKLDDPSRDRRFVCLHDVPDLPGVFNGHQNHRIPPPPSTALTDKEEEEYYSNSDVESFFSNFYNYENLYVASTLGDHAPLHKNIVVNCKHLTEAFKEGRGDEIVTDTPTQLRVEVCIPPGKESELMIIPDEATVTGTYESMSLFGIMPHMQNRQLPQVSWGVLKREVAALDASRPLWLQCLERDILNSANGRVLEGFHATLRDGRSEKTYRPIVARHILYGRLSHKVEVLFVETLPRQFLGARITSVLLACIVMASRFRFAYFEDRDKTAGAFSDYLSDREFETSVRQLLYDIDRLDHEAMEFGLDTRKFVAAFGDRKKAEAESFADNWLKAREKLCMLLPSSGVVVDASNRHIIKAAVGEFLKAVELENERFLRIAIDLYSAEMREQLSGGRRGLDLVAGQKAVAQPKRGGRRSRGSGPVVAAAER